MLAYGWTISKSSMDMDDIDIAVPIGLFILVIHALIGGLIFVDSEEHHKYHDYQGAQGILLIIFRILMYLAFAYGYWSTKTSLKERDKLGFLKIIFWTGNLYFLSLPLSVLVCEFLNPYQQQSFIVYSNRIA